MVRLDLAHQTIHRGMFMSEYSFNSSGMAHPELFQHDFRDWCLTNGIIVDEDDLDDYMAYGARINMCALKCGILDLLGELPSDPQPQGGFRNTMMASGVVAAIVTLVGLVYVIVTTTGVCGP